MIRKLLLTSLSLFFLGACGSKFLKYEKESELKDIHEFNQKVDIVIPEDDTEASPPSVTPVPTPTPTPVPDSSLATEGSAKVRPGKKQVRPAKKAKVKGASAKTAKSSLPEAPKRRPPELESDLGFQGRRPLVDPFRPGEKVVHQVHYYSVPAGTLEIAVKPFAQVNGRKSYNFGMTIKTSSWYSSIYSVDDRVTTLVDFETLVPSVFQLHVRESGQLRESRMLFDKNQATFWERKVTKKDGEEERRLNWEILEYSQNLYSGIFYMRVFQWPVGVENAFRVADDGKNMIFRGKAVRKEKISTSVGEFNTVVIQPQIELQGKYQPVGDIFIWLSDDDRKFILRIESKIKIGTLVSEVIELKP